MKVKIVYRNYKPLHDLYATFKIVPPPGVTYIIPPPRRFLRRFYPFYARFGDNPTVRTFISQTQRLLFDMDDDPAADILHFTQMAAKTIPAIPYVVDFEHSVGLANFLSFDHVVIDQIRSFLSHPRCRRIMPLSEAALGSLETLLQMIPPEVAAKTEVIYPALPPYFALYQDQVDYKYVTPRPERFKLLFVGNDVYKKGLHELLAAFKILIQTYDDIDLYVISNAPASLRRAYDSPQIKHFEPRFSHDEIVTQFFLPCDLFVLPTHGDTFGMALLYALACGTPVLTTRQFATPEMIVPHQNGLFVEADRLYLEATPLPSRVTTKAFYQDIVYDQCLIDDLIAKIVYFYHNRTLLPAMGRRAGQDFEPNGKFSIERRNRKLAAVYRRCYESSD